MSVLPYRRRIRQRIATSGDQLTFAFRHCPMRAVHPHAQHAAEVAEAAAAQGRFWDMHDRLFTGQDALDDNSLLRHASELSLDWERVREELSPLPDVPRIPGVRWPGEQHS
jgi:NhaA family Na+:H+ antiporter